MSHPSRRFPSVSLLLLAIVSSVLVAGPLDDASADANGIVSDDFSAPTLNTGRWNVVDPVGDATVGMTDTGVSVSLPGGTEHDHVAGVDRTVRLLQVAPNGNFTVDVGFETLVGPDASSLGLLVQQDGDDHLRFEVRSQGCLPLLVVTRMVAGVRSTLSSKEISSGSPTHIRVARTGSTWAFSYSYDSRAWASAARIQHGMTVTAVGPFVGNGGAAPPAFTGVIDFLVNAGAPPALEDGAPYSTAPAAPVIELWYGSTPSFGSPGRAQPWANILGNVSDPDGVRTLTYSLNGGPATKLSIGPNGTRLQMPGDFNIELPYDALVPGANTVRITATDVTKRTTVRDVTVNVAPPAAWPTTYAIDWGTTSAIEQVAQVVDGRFSVQQGAARVEVPGYDRLIGLGDPSWTDYQVVVPITIHGLSFPACSTSANNRPGIGVLTGWDGHLQRGTQPGSGPAWGGIGWLVPTTTGTGWSLSILGDRSQRLAEDRTRTFQLGTPYVFKMVMDQTSSDPLRYTYRLKVWPQGSVEPASWDLTGTYGVGGGSILLVAHHADVSFGNVTVTPVP